VTTHLRYFLLTSQNCSSLYYPQRPISSPVLVSSPLNIISFVASFPHSLSLITFPSWPIAQHPPARHRLHPITTPHSSSRPDPKSTLISHLCRNSTLFICISSHIYFVTGQIRTRTVGGHRERLWLWQEERCMKEYIQDVAWGEKEREREYRRVI